MGGFASLQSNIHRKHKKQTQRRFHAEYGSLTVTGSVLSVGWSTQAMYTHKTAQAKFIAVTPVLNVASGTTVSSH